MKTKHYFGIIFSLFCFLFCFSITKADDNVSWDSEQFNYSILKDLNYGEYYNKTSVNIVHEDSLVSFLQFYSGPLNDPLLAFDASIYSKENQENIVSFHSSQHYLRIEFEDIETAISEPGEYLISVAAKTWGEDVALDTYTLSVSEKHDDVEINDDPNNDIITPDVSESVVEEIKVEIKKVNIKKVTRLSSKKAKITWKKIAGTGIRYEIKYSTGKNFKKKNTITKSTKKLNLSISKLKKNKNYYVKIRAYKVIDGQKVYGTYSKIKKINKWKS